MFARRHGKLYLWPVPDGVYTVNVDYASYHPEAFEDILFGPEFNEAIFEGVISSIKSHRLTVLGYGKSHYSFDAGIVFFKLSCFPKYD